MILARLPPETPAPTLPPPVPPAACVFTEQLLCGEEPHHCKLSRQEHGAQGHHPGARGWVQLRVCVSVCMFFAHAHTHIRTHIITHTAPPTLSIALPCPLPVIWVCCPRCGSAACDEGPLPVMRDFAVPLMMQGSAVSYDAGFCCFL